MSENLGHFLVDLACDPALMSQFIGDPAAVLARSPLSDSERALMMARDPRLLSDALGTTAYSVGQIIDGGKPARRRAPGRKKKAPRKPPAKKVPPKKAPRKKAPARPARKRR